MKLILFSLALIFVVLPFCKAGPLRLHKRAVFYIANETACVVDNIVYSNGDPIPTDDPCEACKCRPPGFACVLKECRVKPGCRAVRHLGQCCPDYVCGCEHNGRMYQDGEEIRDAKNPCYVCHCQGSSIACAFVDCFFRIDCVPEYLPGECCPQYSNCTRDDKYSLVKCTGVGEEYTDCGTPCPATCENYGAPLSCASVCVPGCFCKKGLVRNKAGRCVIPEKCENDLPDSNSFENNNVPLLSLLPVLNDDSIFPVDLPTTREPDSFEIPTDPPVQPLEVDDKSDETEAPEVKESTTTEVNEPQTTETENAVPEESQLDPVTENNAEADSPPTDSNSSDANEERVLFNSETEIKSDENAETTTTVKNVETTEPNDEVVKDDPQTTVASSEESVNKAEVTTKIPDTESTTTEIPPTEKEVKNSAADNSKSLKLSDDEDGSLGSTNVPGGENESKSEEPQSAESTSDEPEAQSSTQTSETESADPPVGTESNPEPEIVPEESENKPKSVLYSSDDKIKSESAETITIVVHVNEKQKLTTETDFVAEEVTSESVTSATSENLEKSNDELNKEISPDSGESVEETSTNSNFKVFATSPESDPSSSSTDEGTHEEVKGRSEETEATTSNPEVSTNSESDAKNEEGSSETTTHGEVEVAETTPAESRTDEDSNTDEETKTDENVKIDDPRVTVIKVNESNVAIKIKITTNPATETPENNEPTESSVTTEEAKSEESEESKPEVREDDSTPEEQTASPEDIERVTAEVVVNGTSPTTELQNEAEERAAETESAENESTTRQNVESTTPGKSQETESPVTTVSTSNNSEEPVQTEAPESDN